MNNKAALDRIYDNLKRGMIYASFLSNVHFPCYWYVIQYDSIKKLFRWRHAGSSANKATKHDLEWIITEIFNLTPCQFENKYFCVTKEQYNMEV